MLALTADEIAKLFPNLFGQPSAKLVPSPSSTGATKDQKALKIGVVLSGGQAPGGHNVISGIFGTTHPAKLLLSSRNYLDW